ncbi:unnamed protein product [Durusdinium trenchii]|uniref:Protein arginine N-methyltransferase domain-containing protein n=1 Tax=Durusdinium trenchii TaxID=1381693 RepID=A0ABP0PBC9_9DINO
MCAGLKGVREVHACEMNDALCSVAQEVIASQKHSCPVTLHPAVSTALKLPKFDLIFCEVFDAGLLGEHALPTILHARKELLKADGLLIPARARIFGQLVEAPLLLERFRVAQSAGVPLKGAYLRNSERYTCETMSVVPHVALTEPVQLVSLDFQEIEYLYSNLGTWIDPPLELHVTKAGAAHALVYWWELDLDAAGECRIHTSPTGGSDSWEQAVKPLTFSIDQALHLHEGDQVHLHLRVQADGLEVLLQDAEGHASSLEAPEPTWPDVELEEEELLRFNDTEHWKVVQSALEHAFHSLPEQLPVQVVDISESLPVALLSPVIHTRASGIVAGVSSKAEKEVMQSLLAHSELPAEVHLLLASPQQVIQAALPAPYPPAKDGPSEETWPAAVLVCEDIVGASGHLRSEALQDLALLWRSLGGQLKSRELRVVPEAISLKLRLIESTELERRTRVVERPGGVDVSEVNALSVTEFLSLEESVLKPKWLSAEVDALTLPLASALPTALAALSARGKDGQPLLRVRLVATAEGKVNGIVVRCLWAKAGLAIEKQADGRLAGILWPNDAVNRAPDLKVGDAVIVTIRYSPARGIIEMIADTTAWRHFVVAAQRSGCNGPLQTSCYEGLSPADF